MNSKTQFIQRFNTAREEMRTLLPKVDLKMEIYPGWTIKEVLAHLAGWDDATILTLQAFVNHHPPLMTAVRGIDFYNSQTVAERKALSYSQIVSEWEWVREQLIPILGQMDEQKLQATLISPWGPSMSVADLLNVMIHHEEEHAQVIRDRVAHPEHPTQPH